MSPVVQKQATCPACKHAKKVEIEYCREDRDGTVTIKRFFSAFDLDRVPPHGKVVSVFCGSCGLQYHVESV